MPPRWTGGGAAPISSLPGRAVKILVSWLPCLQNRDYDGVLSNSGMSTPASKRLKSSVRKAKPYSPRWQRWSTVCPSGLLAVEEPTFLMATPTPLSSNSLYEGPTWWWRWRSLMSLLSARSYWAEQAVNCMLKAYAIAFELGWVFLSKAIEMFGGGLDLLPPSLCGRDL